MTDKPPNPLAEQPRYFTVFDLLFELVSVAFVCGGFYAGYSYKGVWVGLLGGMLARMMFVIVMMESRGWVNRRSERREK